MYIHQLFHEIFKGSDGQDFIFNTFSNVSKQDNFGFSNAILVKQNFVLLSMKK